MNNINTAVAQTGNQTLSGGLKELSLIHKVSLYSVLCFIFLIPWGDGIWDGLARVFGILSFGLASLLLITEGTHKKFSYFHLFVLALWAWLILSVIWTLDINRGIDLTSRAIQIMLLPFLFSLIITNRKSILLAYQSYVLGNVVAATIILYNYLNGIQSPYYNRFTVQNIETDTMSIILALSIPMAAHLAAHLDKKGMRLFYLAIIPLIVFAIFLTGTRTGSIVAVFGISYWLFTHRRATFRIKMSIAVVLVLSIITVATFAPKASVDRVFSAGKSLKSGNLNSRTDIWKASISQWKNTPIIGVGFGGLGYALSREHVNYNGAHNTYIQLLTEGGLIALTLYLLLLGSILYLILQTRLSEKIFLLSLFMVIIVSQLTLHLHIQKETWFTLSMLAIHASYARKRSTG